MLKNTNLHSSLGLRQITPEKLRGKSDRYFDLPKPEKDRDHMHEEDYQVLKAAMKRQAIDRKLVSANMFNRSKDDIGKIMDAQGGEKLHARKL